MSAYNTSASIIEHTPASIIANTLSSKKTFFIIAIVQFLIGVLITIVNTLMVALLITTVKMRKDVTHCLLTNMWFVNLLLGVIIAVVNVVEGESETVSIEKPKGTITIINSMVTIATLFALITNRLLIIRSRNMTLKHVAVIISLIWAVVIILTFIKAIVSSLYKYDTANPITCWKCFLNFEVAVLILLGIVCVCFLIIAVGKQLMRKKQTIAFPQTQPAQQPATVVAPSPSDEIHTTVTIGIMLVVFLLVMASYILMQAVWISYQKDFDVNASEIIICIFYLHCLINPAVLMCRDKEARLCLKKLITCKNNSEDVQANRPMTEMIMHSPYQPNVQMIELPPQYPSQYPPQHTVQIEKPLPPLPPTLKRLDTDTSLPRHVAPVDNSFQEDRQSAQKFRRPTAPPDDISHIDNKSLHNHRLSEQNIGFVENGELVGHM